MTRLKPVDDMSILNCDPQRLPGPQLLQNLVAQTSKDGSAAIEHQSSAGICERLTYEQLHAISNSLAQRLHTLVSANGKVDGPLIVPCYIPQSLELYVSQLAILKAGGAFCPIVLDVPEERLRFILEDIGARVLLTVLCVRSQLPPLEDVEVISVNVSVLGASDHAPMLSVKPSDAAYVMFTSGTTGKPKGVVISHSAATQALLAHDEHIPPFSRFLQFANPTFDVSVFEIFFPLYRGCTLVSCDRRRLLNDLPGAINALNIDAAELTPSVASSLLRSRASVPSLKLLLTIGETLKKDVVEEFGGDESQPSLLYAMYGPTEATIHCTLQPASAKYMPVSNIGFPLTTVSAFIVKPSGPSSAGEAPEIVSLGDEGELAVGGHQLATGYLNRPEQTQSAFVLHPEYGRLYRTGDRAVMTPDGKIEYRGRMDAQVKLRGQRVELGEVEYAAAQTSGCQNAVAHVVGGTLVTFCVRDDEFVTANHIITSCRRWLPAFMVPTDIVFIPEVPYLPSAKVDRKALELLYADLQQRRHVKRNTDPLTASLAQKIDSLMAGVIKNSGQGPVLSLDSLSAIRLAAQLRRVGYPLLNATELLEANTVARLAKCLQKSQHEHPPAFCPAPPEMNLPSFLSATQRKSIESAYPCTPVQTSMFAETLKDSSMYCNWVLLEVDRQCTVHQLHDAVQRLSLRHELLRSGIIQAGDDLFTPHVLVWKSLSPGQIKVTKALDCEFSIRQEDETLNLCAFQIVDSSDCLLLLVRIHHALYDQWSMDVFKWELEMLLSDQALDNPTQYGDYARYYLNQSSSMPVEDTLQFWREYLQDFTLTPLPHLSARQLPRLPSKMEQCDIPLDIATCREDARSQGYSLPAVFQTAWAWLLASYSGSPDVIFGTVFSGRHVPVAGIEGIFGPCLATLPFRMDISTVRNVSELLLMAHEGNRAIQKNSIVPLAKIREACGCDPQQPLFDSLVIWQESTVAEAGPLVEEVESSDKNEFSLVLEFKPQDYGVQARATYRPDILPKQQVSTLLQQLTSVVKSIIGHTTQPVSRLLNGLDTNLLSISNPDPVSCAPSEGLTATLENVAKKHADSTALIFASKIREDGLSTSEMAYSQLSKYSNRLANFLCSKGVQPGDLVCICMDKSLDLYISILAVVKAGGGYLPLTPDTPQGRIQRIMDQASVKLTLCDDGSTHLFELLPNDQVINLDKVNTEAQLELCPNVEVAGSHPAYTIFTSGSTGQPKGVTVTRSNLAGNLAVLAKVYKVYAGDRLLQACSQAFDVSVFEIFFALTTGMSLCSATKEEIYHDLELGIRQLGITHLSLTPTTAALVDPENVPGVRFLVTAGEGVTEVVKRKWAGHGLHQGYGPSETTNICTVNMDMKPDEVLGAIGPPLQNTSAFVISYDDELSMLPQGALGEFAFGGEQVFRGYLGREDLNLSKITHHAVYGRLYRSGDTGRILHDGTLLIAGRMDDQVKIRGNRIELSEIDAIVHEDDVVKDCITVVQDAPGVGKRLITFWTLQSSHSTAETVEVAECDRQIISRLFGCLGSSLPSYMVPEMLIPVTKLPFTSQGKRDKRLLLNLLNTSNLNAAHYSWNIDTSDEDTECSPMESQLMEALSDTLNASIDNFTKSTSFFALGLNSLNAISFSKAIEKQLGQRVSIASILKHASAGRLARALSEAAPKTDSMTNGSHAALLPDEVMQSVHKVSQSAERVLPCTPLQEAMLSATLSKGPNAYANKTVFHVHGDVERLKMAWEKLMERHEILRTCFVATDALSHPFVQVILPSKTLPWVSIPGTSQQLKMTMSEPFMIEVQTASSPATLTLHMHHAIYDGLSMEVVLNEAEALYQCEELQPAPTVDSYLLEMQAQNSTEALQFWKERFEDFQPMPSRPKPTAGPHSTQVISKDLTGLRPKVDTFCRRHNATPLTVFQAAWSKVLGSALDVKDLCFGNVVSGRTLGLPGLDRLVAPCFNTIPIRIDLAKCRTNLQIIKYFQTYNLDASRYQLTALRRIQSITKSPNLHLFNSLVLFQPSNTNLNSNIWEKVNDEGEMDVPLVLEVVPGNDDYIVTLHCMQHDELGVDLLEATIAAVHEILDFPSGSTSSFGTHNADITAGKLKFAGVLSSNIQTQPSSDKSWSSLEEDIRDTLAHFSRTDARHIEKQTSIYRLGLDSLSAVQFASQLRKRGMNLDASDVIECQTVAAIAQKISQQPCNGQTESNALTSKRYKIPTSKSVDAVLPCTSVQIGMLVQSIRTNGKLYVNHLTWKLPDNISVDALRRAFRELQKKHPMLRTGFYQVEDAQQPFQMGLHPLESVAVPVEERGEDKELLGENIVRNLQNVAWSVSIYKDSGAEYMLLSIHHALYDAESLQMLLADFSAVLAGQSLEQLEIVPILQATFGDAPSDSSAFWRETMQDAKLVKFPNLHPNTDICSRLRRFSHPSEISTLKLQEYCRHNEVTIQAVGQGLWAQLLAAYAGEETVTFGTIFSTRSPSKSHQTLFPAMISIPVVCKVEGSTADVVRSMVKYNAASYRHRLTPLVDIQHYAGSPREALFDTVFVYQKSSSMEAGLDWERVDETSNVEYTVSFELETPTDGKTLIHLTVDGQRVPDQHAQILLLQYNHLLRQLVRSEQSSHPLDLYSMLPPKVHSIPSKATFIHDFVTESAAKHPDRVALYFVSDANCSEVSHWTYNQLDRRGNQLAQLLRQHGIAAGSIVAARMDKCPEASITFLGISKAGCSFLVLDPNLPESRQQFILEDSGARILLLSGEQAGQWAPDGIPTLHIVESELFNLSEEPVEVGLADGNATAYCLYTSGTTGTPKGCELTHENTIQAMMAFQRLFAGHWTDKSRWFQFASYWFDVSVLEHFWSWSVGIAVVGAPRDIVLDDITSFMRRMQITHIDLTPSLARLVDPKEVPSMHNGVFITGGEALKQEIIDAWGPYKTVCNGYGPTEATIGVTMNPFIGTNAKPSNIGPQFDNVGSLVLRPGTDEPVLRGGLGELCVSGKLVGRGYLNRQELTAKAFPFLDRYKKKVYRTGDLVRMLHDGSFEFVGRKDTQAKLRGQRLEVTEVDHVVKRSSDQIAEVISMVVKGRSEQLVSFITPGAARAGGSLEELQLNEDIRQLVETARQACYDRLPGYMVPTHILPVNFMPLTANNKIDSKRLVALFQDPDRKQLEQGNGDGRPMNDQERQIWEAAAKLLSIEESVDNRNANLFSLGLSSVSAISFATMLKRKGFEAANVALILHNPTIRGLASALSTNRDQQNSATNQTALSMAAFSQRLKPNISRALTLPDDEIEAIVPCTPLQEGLIIESLRSPLKAYFNEYWYRAEEINLDQLQRAVQTITRGIQLLRAVFVETDDGFVQVIRRHQEIHIEVLTDEQVSEARSQWLQENDSNLLQPIKVVFVRAVEPRLHFFVHHAIYDGISWQLLLHCLYEAYNDKEPEYGPKFTDALAHGPLQRPQGAKSFWQGRLDTFEAVSLVNGQDKTTVSVTKCIEMGDLEAGRKQLNVSHQALLQGCFEVTLKHHFPRAQLYGQVVSGRSIDFANADRVIGPLFNTLPCGVSDLANSSWADTIERINEDNIATLPYQHVPLRNIRKWCGWHLGQILDVLFVFQHQAGSNWLPEIEQPANAEYPLAFEISLCTDGTLQLVLVAQRCMVDAKELEAMAETFKMALQAATTSLNDKISNSVQVPKSQAIVGSKPKPVQPSSGTGSFEWSPLALALRRIIAQLAQVEEDTVGDDATIFSLGLDSIDAVKLASRAKREGVHITVSKLLQAQTIPKILAEAHNKPCGSKRAANNSLEHIERQLTESFLPNLPNEPAIERILPATPGQEALIADMIQSEWQNYYNHDILQLSQDTDLDRLLAAWQNVVEQSPILRTGFVQVTDPTLDQTFTQVIYKPWELKIRTLSIPSQADLARHLDRITNSVRHQRQALPLFRVTIAKTKNECYCIVSLAHAQYDGHSLSLLHEDVHRAYQDNLSPRPSNDNVIREALLSANDEARNFWKNALSGASPTPFPRMASCSPQRSHKICSTTAYVAREFCQAQGISLQSLAQTCWALEVAQYTHSLEVIYGVVFACRDDEESEKTMFPLMNTVPVRTFLHGSRAEMVQYMQKLLNDLRPFKRMPLRAIQAGLPRLFDTLFLYQHDVGGQNDELYRSVGGSSSVEFPVAFEIEVVGEELLIRCACRESMLDERGMEMLLDRFDGLLASVIESPEEPTVEVFGRKARICNLPEFELKDASRVEAESGQDDKLEGISSTGEQIRNVLAQVSKVPAEKISADTTIERIGIDSISAIKVAGLLRKQNVHLSVSQIVRFKTIARMAHVADQGGSSFAPAFDPTLSTTAAEKIAEAANLNPGEIETVYPATTGQAYMLSVWAKSNGSLFYPTFRYKLKRSFPPQQVLNAWEQLVAIRPILRTIFHTHQDEVYQIILKHQPKNPMATLHPEGNEIHLKIHHALYDAVSLHLLIQDYAAILSDRPLPPTPLHERDLLSLQHSPTSKYSRQKFYKTYLSNFQPTYLPQPLPRHSRTEIFSPNLLHTGKIASLAKRKDLMIQSIIFAAWAKIYSHLTGGREVVLGIYLSNRSQIHGMEELRFPTLGFVPLRVREPTRALGEVAREVADDLGRLGDGANAFVGLNEVWEWTGVKVDGFVNFLRVPEHEDGERWIVSVEEKRVGYEKVVGSPEPGEGGVLDVDTEGVLFSVDVEFAINKHGGLDVGLFCPEEMVGLERGIEAVDELRRVLQMMEC
ncbi:peptide synthetase [Piedraia hortae CBS 480.64]|uniref:Peptide synthetase n=1 Tax=Piedraia hortae CBS 480.64 TaxID=1314780 RepID=A0A6A7BY53_9PEZI|nr:peptide synthetase [Piedraia hortae CBS 480.64]